MIKNEEELLISYDYPHSLMRHMQVILKEEGQSSMWSQDFPDSFRERYSDCVEECQILEKAYQLEIPARFQQANKQAMWSKRVCINQSLFLLLQEMKEYEAVILIESYMCLLRWEFSITIPRKWEVEENEKANFHTFQHNSGGFQKNNFTGQLISHEKQEQQISDVPEKTERKDGRKVVQRELKTTVPKENFSDKSKNGAGEKSIASDKALQRQEVKEKKIDDRGQQNGNVSSETRYFENLEVNDSLWLGTEPAIKRKIKDISQMSLSMKKEAKRAQKGNVHAQQRLGEYYAEEGTKHLDYKEAVYWYGQAAKQGNYKAQMELGRIFDSGKIQEENSKLYGIRWYRKLAEEGFPTAQCILGIKYLWGDGVEENRAEAVRWLKKAAAQGYEEAEDYLKKLL